VIDVDVTYYGNGFCKMRVFKKESIGFVQCFVVDRLSRCENETVMPFDNME